jgi:hypothetical protein
VFRFAIPCAVAIGATLFGLPNLTAQQPSAARAPLRVQRAEIMDRRGYERPMVAYTLFVPAGWRGQGEVEYPQDNCGVSQRINWMAADPEGVGAIQVIGEEKWSTGNFPVPPDNCLHAPVSGARQYLEWWVQRHRPGARVLDFRPRPELAAPFQRIAQEGNGMRSWGEAGEILIGYQHRGRPVREAISTAVFFIHTRIPSASGGAMEMLQGITAPGFAMRMPEGALDFKAAEALRQSIRSAPEWQSRMNQTMAERNRIAMDHNRRMGEINRQGVADRSAIIANTARDINDIQMGTWQSRNESMDRQQRETIEGIRGVETYNDPHYGGTVQLSNQYQHAWQLRDGSYLLTDDPNFDPARSLNVQGTRLRPAP